MSSSSSAAAAESNLGQISSSAFPSISAAFPGLAPACWLSQGFGLLAGERLVADGVEDACVW